MPIGNGGIIGPANRPTPLASRGIWTLQEAQQAIDAGTWAGFPAKGRPSTGHDPANQTNYTFNNVPLLGPDGTTAPEHPTRALIINPCGRAAGNSRTVSSLDCSGSAATHVTRGASGDAHVNEFWTCPFPTGSTVNLTINHSSSMNSSAYTLWPVYSLKSLTAVDTATIKSQSAMSLDVSEFGLAFVGSLILLSAGFPVTPSSGFVMEVSDEAQASDNTWYQAGSYQAGKVAEVGRSIAPLWFAATNQMTSLCVSFR